MPRNLRKLAYREVDLLLVGAPRAEGHVLDLYHRWTLAGLVRSTAHLARSQPLGHLSQESFLCLVRANLLCSRTSSHLFIGAHCVTQSCSLEHYERVVNRALRRVVKEPSHQQSMRPSPRSDVIRPHADSCRFTSSERRAEGLIKSESVTTSTTATLCEASASSSTGTRSSDLRTV